MNARTAVVGVGLVVVAVVLLIVLSGGEDSNDDTTTSGNAVENEAKGGGGDRKNSEAAAKKPQVPTIVVRDGEPVGGVQTLEYSVGAEIRFRVESDAAEEIHVHGYDIAKDVPAGGAVEFAFPAELEGIFEAELEDLGVQILELRINP